MGMQRRSILGEQNPQADWILGMKERDRGVRMLSDLWLVQFGRATTGVETRRAGGKMMLDLSMVSVRYPWDKQSPVLKAAEPTSLVLRGQRRRDILSAPLSTNEQVVALMRALAQAREGHTEGRDAV